jgi:hypothetical protein
MGVGVIRFRCPKCGHLYEVLEAMAGLPLICKRCRESLWVPWPSQLDPPLPKSDGEPHLPAPFPAERQTENDKPIDDHAKPIDDHANHPESP